MKGVARRPARKNVLFVLAHQDDEIVMSPRIARELESGHGVYCAFLTDGSARVASRVRDAESRAVLTGLGVPSRNLFFLGSEHGLTDGKLPLQLERADRLLEEALAELPIHRIFCLAYEGGHQDHDASHLLALALARRRGLLGRSWQISAYHGYRMPGPVFRVLAPLRGPRRFVRRLPAGLAWRHTLLCLRYRSQRLTWLGLFPGLALQRGLRRRETVLPVALEAVRARPHPGPLLYEQLFGFRYEDFRSAADAFTAARLEGA